MNWETKHSASKNSMHRETANEDQNENELSEIPSTVQPY